jgi:tetratricopeptide (TPR) repeat protein
MHYLDCDFNQLINLNKKIKLQSSMYSKEHTLFAQIYEHFLAGNTETLVELGTAVLATHHTELIANYELKVASRLHQQDSIDFSNYVSKFTQCQDSYFKAELAFGLARICEKKTNWTEAYTWYETAEKLYSQLNCKNKELKCEINKYCTLYNEKKDPSLVHYYFKCYRESVQIKNFELMCISLNNISRTYYGMRAYLTAFKYNSKAMSLINFTAPYFRESAKLHHAEILFHIGKPTESAQLIEEVSLSSFSEMREAARFVSENKTKTDTKNLPEPYQIKLSHVFKLSQGEAKVFDFLMTGPKDLSEIIDYLYGQKISYTSAQNRLGNLLFRVRKKTNKKIVIKEQKVFLSI